MTTPLRGLAPLSFQQQEQLRRLYEHPECASTYDLARLYELDRNVEVERLAASVNDLVRRHDILRTTIEDSASGHRQRVHDDVLEPLTGAMTEAPSVADVANRLVERRYGTADVCGGAPLFRPALHTVGGTPFLSFGIHHVIYDGWTLSLLWRDLAEIYQARLERRDPVLPPPGISYAQFASEQRAQWPAVAKAAVPYWRDVLEDAPEYIEWPTSSAEFDSDPYHTDPYHTDMVAFSLSSSHCAAVRTVAQTARVTPFTVLLSATAMAITTVTGQDDLVLGTDTWGRTTESALEVAGLMLNTRITRARPDARRTLTELSGAVWRDWRNAERHRDAHIEPTLRELGRSHLTKVGMVQHDDEAVTDLTLSGTTAKRLTLPLDGRYWRDFFVDWSIGADVISAEVFHRPSIVDRPTVGLVVDALLQILDREGRHAAKSS